MIEYNSSNKVGLPILYRFVRCWESHTPHDLPSTFTDNSGQEMDFGPTLWHPSKKKIVWTENFWCWARCCTGVVSMVAFCLPPVRIFKTEREIYYSQHAGKQGSFFWSDVAHCDDTSAFFLSSIEFERISMMIDRPRAGSLPHEMGPLCARTTQPSV